MSGRKRRSKKRSAANSTQPEPALVFFVDECLGRHVVPEALRAAGALVERHCDHFPPGVSDVEWLREVGARGWIVLTKDKSIRRRPLEYEAFTSARCRVFVLTATDVTGDEQAAILVGSLRAITRLARRPPSFIARVTRMGDVSVI